VNLPVATHAAAVLRAVWDVPVDPDRDTARGWLEAELTDPIYHEGPSLLDRLLAWIMEQLDNAQRAASQVDPLLAAAVVIGIALVVGVVAFLVAGPVAPARRARRSAEVFGDDTRTATELRTAADAHAAAGRFDEAVLDRFRAILRSLEERALLDPRPGTTADEGAALAGARLADRAEDLRAAASLFDDVCYGDRATGRDDDVWLREVDARVAATRPERPAVPA
jgi:hypothetical protein